MGATQFLHRLDQRTQPLYGAWSTLPGPLPVELLARSGADYVVVDCQHGGATDADLPGMIAAIEAAGAFAFVRPRHRHFADVGRALDAGAGGVIVPNVDSGEDAAAVAAACAYPPAGARSFGQLRPGPTQPACIVMIESAAALAAVTEIVAVPGVSGLYVGPFDLGLSLGVVPGDADDPVLSAAIDTVLSAADRVGIPVGVHATTGTAAARLRRRGCRLITVGSDAGLLATGLETALAQAAAD